MLNDKQIFTRHYYTIYKILRPLSLAKSLLKAEKRQFCTSGNQQIRDCQELRRLSNLSHFIDTHISSGFWLSPSEDAKRLENNEKINAYRGIRKVQIYKETNILSPFRA